MNAPLADGSPWPIPWLILFVLYGLPLLHVALSRQGGGWRPPPGSRCPFGPRAGWLVMVLMLGPVGWLLFAVRRPRVAGGPPRPPVSPTGTRPVPPSGLPSGRDGGTDRA